MVITGVIPANIIFSNASEIKTFKMDGDDLWVRVKGQLLKLSDPTKAKIVNGISLMAAFFCSQAASVPIEVVCFRAFFCKMNVVCIDRLIYP